jgi:hypothetical protein
VANKAVTLSSVPLARIAKGRPVTPVHLDLRLINATLEFGQKWEFIYLYNFFSQNALALCKTLQAMKGSKK